VTLTAYCMQVLPPPSAFLVTAGSSAGLLCKSGLSSRGWRLLAQPLPCRELKERSDKALAEAVISEQSDKIRLIATGTLSQDVRMLGHRSVPGVFTIH
jgi:hypothetical protein